jgi:hypothetical protein
VDAGYILKEIKATMTIKVVRKYEQTTSKYSPTNGTSIIRRKIRLMA